MPILPRDSAPFAPATAAFRGASVEGYLLSSVNELLAACQAGSLWYLTFGLACCAVEMMHTAAARYDFDRFGMIPRASPRVIHFLACFISMAAWGDQPGGTLAFFRFQLSLRDNELMF